MKFNPIYKGLATSALGIPLPDDQARELDGFLDSGEFFKFEKHSTNVESFLPGERSDISIISDNSLDSDKEVFIPKSIDFSRFQKNPIVTFGHDWWGPPVGKSLWQKLIANTTWKAKTQYASRPETLDKSIEWLPDTLFHLVKEGFLPGKSVGGVAKFREPTKEDIEKNPDWAGVKRISENVLIYEYSVVPIQANKNAIVEAVAKSIVKFPEETLQKHFPDVWAALKETKDDIELPSIKNYITAEQYKEQILGTFAQKCAELPNMVDDFIAGALGQV